jgi:ElaA protein
VSQQPQGVAPTDARSDAGDKARDIATWHWNWLRFHELGVDNLYDALALRCRVFILEQGPYLDPDGLDRHSWHLLGRNGVGTLLAYARVVDPGLKYAEPSLGRVIVAPEARGTGAGHRLVAQALLHGAQAWPGQGNRISAQAHLQGFYAAHGFAPVGPPYSEDNIPHVQMFKHGEPSRHHTR